MRAGRRDFQRALDVVLAFDLAEVCGDEERLKFITAGGLIRRDETAASQMVEEIRERFNGNNLQVGNQSRFRRIHFGSEHPLESIGTCASGHWQNPACVTYQPIQGKFTNYKCILYHPGKMG